MEIDVAGVVMATHTAMVMASSALLAGNLGEMKTDTREEDVEAPAHATATAPPPAAAGGPGEGEEAEREKDMPTSRTTVQVDQPLQQPAQQQPALPPHDPDETDGSEVEEEEEEEASGPGTEEYAKKSPAKKRKTSSTKAKATKATSAKKKQSADKKKRDAELGKPKKPQSAYLLFSASVREELASDKTLRMTDISKEAGARWAKIDPKKKHKYEAAAAELKAHHEKAMAEWRQAHPEEEEEEHPTSAGKATKKRAAPKTKVARK